MTVTGHFNTLLLLSNLADEVSSSLFDIQCMTMPLLHLIYSPLKLPAPPTNKKGMTTNKKQSGVFHQVSTVELLVCILPSAYDEIHA